MKIKNKEALDRWIDKRLHLDHLLRSEQGPPPAGATYTNGELIQRQVKVAWVDAVTKERFDIEYDVEEPTWRIRSIDL